MSSTRLFTSVLVLGAGSIAVMVGLFFALRFWQLPENPVQPVELNPQVTPRDGSGLVSGGNPPGSLAGNKYAFLVGVNAYDHANLPRLRYAVNDVAVLAELLGKGGYQVTLLTDSSVADLKPTRANINKQLPALLRSRQKGDLVVLGFAGHGLQFTGQKDAFFCPSDAVPFANRAETLISMAKVYEELEQSKASTKVLLVDACRNDPAQARSGLTGATVATPLGVAALFSCKPGQQSFESQKLQHGLFFHQVLEGLRGQAKHNDQVAFDRLATFVAETLPKSVKEHVSKDAEQSPNLKANYSEVPVLLAFGAPPKGQEPGTVVIPSGPKSGTVAYSTDLSKFKQGEFPEGWDADPAIVLFKKEDTATLQATEQGKHNLVIPVTIRGDFYLEYEFETPHAVPLDLTLQGRGGAIGLPIQISADWNYSIANVQFPGGAVRTLKTEAAGKPALLRVEREGFIYRVSLNGKLAHARRVTDYKDFSAVKFVLVGQQQTKFSALRVGPLPGRPQIAKVAQLNAAEAFRKGYKEQFRTTIPGDLPPGWKGDDALGVRLDEGAPRLESGKTEKQQAELPPMHITGDFYLEWEFETPHATPMELVLPGHGGGPSLPIKIISDANYGVAAVHLATETKSVPLTTAAGRTLARVERQGDLFKVSLNGELALAKKLPDYREFRGVQVILIGGGVSARLYNIRLGPLEK